jgi:hypothetical protein
MMDSSIRGLRVDCKIYCEQTGNRSSVTSEQLFGYSVLHLQSLWRRQLIRPGTSLSLHLLSLTLFCNLTTR